MGKVLTHMAMSLDGFIATPDDDPQELFDWYWGGDHIVPSHSDMSFQVDQASAGMLRELLDRAGVVIAGRRLFDQTNGWDDRHPGAPKVVVVTHEPPADADRWPNTTFVDGVETAVTTAKGLAGDKDVTIASPTIINGLEGEAEALEDFVVLVPVLFGEGIPYFGSRAHGHLMLEDPEVIQGRRALHLRYQVRR